MVCFVVTQHSESALSLCLRYSKTSCEATPKKIHGTHGEHGFSLKILLKIFVKMSSRRRSKIKPSPKARYSSAFWSRIFVKDSCGVTKTSPSAFSPQPSDLSLQPSNLSPQPSALTPRLTFLIHLGDSSAAMGHTVSSSSSIG